MNTVQPIIAFFLRRSGNLAGEKTYDSPKMFSHVSFAFLLCIFSSGSLTARGETLARLEAITARYSTMAALLNDPEGLKEYREALKTYMGEGESFNPVFNEFVQQIRDVSQKVPGFAEQAWKQNPEWQKQAYAIRGESTGSGLTIKREPLVSAIAAFQEEGREQSKTLLQLEGPAREAEIHRIVTEIRNDYGLLSGQQIANLSRRAEGEYRAKLKGIAVDPRIKLLASYVGVQLVSRHERILDALNSGDADVISNEMRKLEKPGRYKEVIKNLVPEIPEELFGYLKFATPTQQAVLSAYERGVTSTKEFQHIADARMDAHLLARLQELQAGGVEPWDFQRYLYDYEQEELRKWQERSGEVMKKKQRFADLHNSDNPYFFYDLYKDEVKGTLRLKSQSGLELHLIPTPRPFHALFAGRKKGECVGGRDCIGLTPRRWARAALKGAETLFTETGDGKMEGYIGLTPIVSEKTKEEYHVVDIMSHAIKGAIVVRDESGRLTKFSFFDHFVDQQKVPADSHGLIISDGNSVSMNVGAGEVVTNAPSYVEDRVVGKPSEFSPSDPIANIIAKTYPTGGYPGGMIYDGMKTDGTKVVLLVPKKDQRRWTKEDLEHLILQKITSDRDRKLDDRDVVWKIASQNGINLEAPSYYAGTGFLLDVLRGTNAESIDLVGKSLWEVGRRLPFTEINPYMEKKWHELGRGFFQYDGNLNRLRARFRTALYFPTVLWSEELMRMFEEHPETKDLFYSVFKSHPFSPRQLKFDDSVTPANSLWGFYYSLFRYLRESTVKMSPRELEQFHKVLLARVGDWDSDVVKYTLDRLRRADPKIIDKVDHPLGVAFVEHVASKPFIRGNDLPLIQAILSAPAFSHDREAMLDQLDKTARNDPPPEYTDTDLPKSLREEKRGLRQNIIHDPNTWRDEVLPTIGNFIASGDERLQRMALRQLEFFEGPLPENVWRALPEVGKYINYPEESLGLGRPQFAALADNVVKLQLLGRGGKPAQMPNKLESTLTPEMWDLIVKVLGGRTLMQVVERYKEAWDDGLWNALIRHSKVVEKHFVDILEHRPEGVAISPAAWSEIDKRLPLPWRLLSQERNLPPETWHVINERLLRSIATAQFERARNRPSLRNVAERDLKDVVGFLLGRNDLPQEVRWNLESRKLSRLLGNLSRETIVFKDVNTSYRNQIRPRSYLGDCAAALAAIVKR